MKINIFAKKIIEKGGDGIVRVLEKCPECGRITSIQRFKFKGSWYWMPRFFEISEAKSFDFDFESKFATLTFEIEGSVVDCECNWREYASSWKHVYEDKTWDNFTLFHGLSAYHGAKTLKDAVDSIETMAICPEMEICCSTSQLGPYGIAVKGEILVASKKDLWSDYDQDCRRYYDFGELDLIVHRRDAFSFDGWHNEYIVKAIDVDYIWVKEDTPLRTRKFLEEYAYERGFDFFIVKEE